MDIEDLYNIYTYIIEFGSYLIFLKNIFRCFPHFSVLCSSVEFILHMKQWTRIYS